MLIQLMAWCFQAKYLTWANVDPNLCHNNELVAVDMIHYIHLTAKFRNFTGLLQILDKEIIERWFRSLKHCETIVDWMLLSIAFQQHFMNT